MQLKSLPFVTVVTADGNNKTARPKYRETIPPETIYAEILLRASGAPLTPERVFQLGCQIILEYCLSGHKVGPMGDDAIMFQCTCGGSTPIGEEMPHTFDGLQIALDCNFSFTSRAWAKTNFTAEKVGEQNRVVPIFVAVYDSMSGLPNHYVGGQGLTIVLGNNNPEFDPTNQNHYVRFRKQDGTWVKAASYAYFKGNKIIAIPPADLTGQVEMEVALTINGSVRSAVYAFPLS